MDDQQERQSDPGIARGKPDAWRALYEAYAEQRLAVRRALMGPSSADVADVVQETFLAAARSAGTYDAARGSLWLWLWGIARRHVALHYRKQQRHDRLKHAGDWLAAKNGQVLRCLEGREEAPPDVLEAAELATLVRATLTELPADYEALLTAKYLDGISVEHLASQERCTQHCHPLPARPPRQAFRQVFEKHGIASPNDPVS